MDTLFERELAKRLAELKLSRIETFTQQALTIEEYRRQFGYLQCIRDIEAMCDDIRSDHRKGEVF